MRWVLAVPLVALAGFGLSATDGSSAHAVAGIAATNRATSVYASPLTRRRVPHPPAKVGCYRFVATGWKRTACDTSTFVRAPRTRLRRPEFGWGKGVWGASFDSRPIGRRSAGRGIGRPHEGGVDWAPLSISDGHNTSSTGPQCNRSRAPNGVSARRATRRFGAPADPSD